MNRTNVTNFGRLIFFDSHSQIIAVGSFVFDVYDMAMVNYRLILNGKTLLFQADRASSNQIAFDLNVAD